MERGATGSTLRDGLARYFAENGFPADGGYGARWVVLRVGRVPVGVFPNTKQRVRAVRLHDLHHVLTGYETTWRGEAEIGAWELASGCGDYPAAWVLNGIAAGIGLLLCPGRLRSAWRRGRRNRNLYAEGYRESLLDEDLASLRARLGLEAAR